MIQWPVIEAYLLHFTCASWQLSVLSDTTEYTNARHRASRSPEANVNISLEVGLLIDCTEALNTDDKIPIFKVQTFMSVAWRILSQIFLTLFHEIQRHMNLEGLIVLPMSRKASYCWKRCRRTVSEPNIWHYSSIFMNNHAQKYSINHKSRRNARKQLEFNMPRWCTKVGWQSFKIDPARRLPAVESCSACFALCKPKNVKFRTTDGLRF